MRPSPADAHARVTLPPGVRACLLDLDGVLTSTVRLHLDAWTATLDPLLAAHGLAPFTPADYRRHVDGRRRLDGVRGLLAARGVALPEGGPDDPPGTSTVHALARAKDERFVALLRERGVELFPDARVCVEALRGTGLAVAVVTASAHGRDVLAATGLDRLVDVVVDGLTASREHLAGKPAPDTFLAAARALGTGPSAAAVVEDAEAGVAAGRAGGFAVVVGVDRDGTRGPALRAAGADLVVPDLTGLLEPA